jgi:hypothetical protein
MKVHHCEPLEFSCHDLGRRTTVVVVEFKTESERSSFAEQFAAENWHIAKVAEDAMAPAAP